MNENSRKALTLVEILIALVVFGTLAAMLMPAVERLRESAAMTADAGKIREIGEASLIFANDHAGRLPPYGGNGTQGLNGSGNTVGMLLDDHGATPHIHAIAAALARYGGLNDATAWISTSDGHPNVNIHGQLTVLTGPSGDRTLTPTFSHSGVSYAYIAGRTLDQPANQPLLFTRGLYSSGGDGRWVAMGNHGVYGAEGGYIFYLGGTVTFHKNTGETPATGIFTYHQGHSSAGQRTNTIKGTVSSTQAIFSDPSGPSGTVMGSSGS